ncbi:unnamed protein product, partial [Owenia fusiformis]
MSSGSQVEELVLALVDAAYDNNSGVCNVISTSILDLGKKQTKLVLTSCHTYLEKHPKLASGHRVVILNCIERIVNSTIAELDHDIAVDLIKQASQEMTQSKEISPDWQSAASGVLVAIGSKFCNEVMEDLLQKFHPGTLPHFFVLQTMANLASANVYGIVPFLNVVLGTMLPMMGMAKQDNLRWVFSSALGKFSEAILDYVANLEKAPDPTVRKEVFSAEIFAAYDVLFNIWLISKEAKLRLAVVEAIGHMVHILSQDKLMEQLPKLIPAILGLYRKHSEPFHVTQGLCMVLDAATQDSSNILEPYLESVLGALFPQACTQPDYANPWTVKNYNEVLRSFTVIAKSFSDRLVGFLLQRMEGSNEKTRIGSLCVFRHLINAADEHLENKKSLVVSGLKIVLNDPNRKVGKIFAQVIIAMAHHEYLELEGGHAMVEFIVRQSALQDDPPGRRPPDPEYVSCEALRSMCDNILNLATTTIEPMEPVLWPYLLEFVVPEKYTGAAGVVCRSISHIAAKKRANGDQDYEIDFDTQVNIPKSVEILARMLVLAGRPLHGRNCGIHILSAMKSMSPNFHENLVELWDTVIPKLIAYLEEVSEDEEKWSQKNWEDLMLKMLSKSVEQVNDEEWLSDFGEALGSQIPLYSTSSEEKNFLYKCLGIVLRKSTKKDFVNKQIDVIFSSVKHTSQTEREGCAIGLGFSATSHLDAVLAKLEHIAKNDIGKKSSGFLGFIKDMKSDENTERVKATLMLCYGFVTLYSPPLLIVSRMEASILRSIDPHFSHIKDTSVKQNLIRTVQLIGKALHVDHLQTAYSFTKRKGLLTHMQTYLKAEHPKVLDTETRALAIDACTSLIKLEPKLEEAEMFDVIKDATDCVMGLPLDAAVGSKKTNKEETYDQVLEHEVLLEATLESLDELLRELLLRNLDPSGLQDVYKHVFPWMVSLHEFERERAVQRLLKILNCYLDNFSLGINSATSFQHVSSLLGRLVPRCTDPELNVREAAIDCIHTALKILNRYAGRGTDEPDQMVDALPTLKERLKKTDPNVLFSVIKDLSKVLCKKLPSDQLSDFMEKLYDGLLDAQSHSSSGACVLMNSTIKLRGSELHSQVEYILGVLHEKLGQIECPQTRTGTLRAIRTLSSHHLLSVLTSLLTYPIPYNKDVCDMWTSVAEDEALTSSLLDHILDLLSRSLPYEEKTDPRDKEKTIKTSMQLPLSAISALTEIFKVEASETVVTSLYHKLFAALLVAIGSTVGCRPPKHKEEHETKSGKDKKSSHPVKDIKIVPASIAVDALKQLLIRSKSDALAEAMEEGELYEKLQDEDTYQEAVTSIAKSVSENQPDMVSRIVSCLNPVLSGPYDSQRVVAAAFFAELINQKCCGDMTLVELLMNSLLGRLVDTNHVVRMLCIRGLGNIASLGHQQVQKYATTILSAMMAGMDDKDDVEDDITLEAMEGL